MKIRIISDLHMDLLNSNDSYELPVVKADILVLAGDINTGTKADMFILEQLKFNDVIYIMGNHEGYGQVLSDLVQKFYGETTAKINRQASEKGYKGSLYFLENTAVEIKGIRFLGTTLWSDFDNESPKAMADALNLTNDYQFIKNYTSDLYNAQIGNILPEQTIQLHKKSMAFLEKQFNQAYNEKTVVVSHHLPSFKSLDEKKKNKPYSWSYASNLDKFVAQSKAKLWIHGHSHTSNDYMIGDTRIVCNPRGCYNNLNPHFNAELIINL